ncbi:MAG TPA: hypothetical protein VGB66_00135, partial [Longimicrobium sp.]
MKSRIGPARARRGGIGRALLALAFAGLATASCGDATGTQNLASLTVSPPTATVAVNGTVQLSAAGTRVGFAETRIEGETWTVSSGGGTVN